MKLIVLVPSEEYKSYAGARIRYARVADQLATVGVALDVQRIDAFNPTSVEFDGLLISKCHDARSLILAAEASGRARLVGIDLFDDYFSQKSNARLVAYRNWLGQIVEMCDFAVCSTEAMANIARDYRADLPVHVLNDPAPQHQFLEVATLVAAKLAEGRDSNCLRLAWFGVGDNPNFPIGLSDLAAYGGQLQQLTKSGLAVRLTILTNCRALTASALSALQRLPVAWDVREWSEAAEKEVLRESLLAFLPVNAQPFSVAKSMNRAFTAMSNGCQVLSAGFPLYGALGELIYRDVEDFLADLARGSLRLSAQRDEAYALALSSFADGNHEAQRLASFLAAIRQPQGQSLPVALIHGHSTREDAHRLVQALGGFSVASPFCVNSLDFDVLFRGTAAGLDVFVLREAAARVLPGGQHRLTDRRRVGEGTYFRAHFDNQGSSSSMQGERPTVAYQLAAYGRTMREISSRMVDLFGPCRTVTSETSSLPFSVSRDVDLCSL